MNNLNGKYLLLLLLGGINMLSIYGALSIFTTDPYALFVSIFINMPLGLLTLATFLMTWWKEENKILVRKYILVTGIILGTITFTLSPLLFVLAKP